MSRIFGSMAKALAMPMRCFMPPEISWGSLWAAWLMCTISSAAAVRSFNFGLPSLPLKTRSTAR